MRIYLLFIGVSLISLKASADHKSIVDNDSLLTAYLHQNTFSIDSNASAIILRETGTSFLFKTILNYHVERTIKVLREEGIAAAGQVRIPSFGDQTIKNVEGVTYNLENGEVVAQRVSNADVVDENIVQDYSVLKFNLPSIRVGSIVHYSFTIEYRTIAYIPAWQFQHSMPTLYSKYNVGIPKFWLFSNLLRSAKTFIPVNSEDQLEKVDAGVYQWEDGARGQLNITWLRQNVPALKFEPFCKSSDNYAERVKVHFSVLKIGGAPVYWRSSWKQTNKDALYDGELYPKPFQNNGFLKDKVAALTDGVESDLEKAQRIYAFVRDSFMVDPERRIYQLHLRQVFNQRRGISLEINLLLAAMLQRAGLTAEPALVAAKPSEPLNRIYPDLSGSYDFCVLTIDDKHYLLDASRKYLPFGMLRPMCYNGFCWVVNKKGYGIEISPNQLHNNRTTVAVIKPDSTNTSMILSMDVRPGQVAAYRMRNRWEGDLTAAKTALKAAFSGGVFQVADVSVKHLSDPDQPLSIHYTAIAPIGGTAVMYLNPVLDKFYSENPFPHTKRVHNIDLDFVTKDQYFLRFTAPEHYAFDGDFKSIQLKSKDGALNYINLYRVGDDARQLEMRSSFSIGKTTFPVAAYNEVRGFFEQMIARQNEKIILRKIEG